MKVYIATPVNGRPEATIEEKRKAAYHRVCHIKVALKRLMPEAEFHSSFDEDIAPITESGKTCWSEPSIMGACVQRVMECDAIYMDKGWYNSDGCSVEHHTAVVYKKKIIEFFDL